MDCDVDDEEKVNPMMDIAGVIGKDSASKLVEGCRLTLSAISFVRRVVRHPGRRVGVDGVISAKAGLVRKLELLTIDGD